MIDTESLRRPTYGTKLGKVHSILKGLKCEITSLECTCKIGAAMYNRFCDKCSIKNLYKCDVTLAEHAS